MTTHDIIDNRSEQLIDHINKILSSAEAAKIAVGYFFLSGFEAVADQLDGLQKIRILIGNTTSRETIEQISEGYKRLELARIANEKEQFQNRSERRHSLEFTAQNIRKTIELMDQTDAGETLVQKFIRFIRKKRLEVRVYTKGRLHAKAYIFDYPSEGHYEKGIAIVGSSNLSLAGLNHNTELNVMVHGNENHQQLSRWFEDLWGDAQDFDELFMQELRHSWAAALAKPYDIYMKTLYALVSDRLDEGDKSEILLDDEITRSLADFQKAAVRQAIQMIRDFGGTFVSDVVGLGKSYIGAGIVKHFQRVEGGRPLIICPKPLEEMWIGYNETFGLDAIVLPMSKMQFDSTILEEKRFRNRDFVLIDESHNFRHHSSQRYEVLQDYLMKGVRKVCLVTATPRNKSALDVYHQIKLFHHDDITPIPIDPPNLKAYFKKIEKGESQLQNLLVHILIRRTRRHILRWYGFAADSGVALREMSDNQAKKYLVGRAKAYVMVAGRRQFFPQRELETLRYSIDETYSGLYDQIRIYLGRPAGKRYSPKPGKELTYARYGLWHYVLKDHKKREPYRSLDRAGVNLRGLIRVMMFKRFESSVYAFHQSLIRLERIHGLFLDMLEKGIVPAGDEAQKLLYESDTYEEDELADRLREASGRYSLEDFDGDRLWEHIEADRALLQEMIELVKPIRADKDAKLQLLIKGLEKGIPQETGKVLIFTQFADTAQYIYQNLNQDGDHNDIEAIYGTSKSKALVAARFAPKANPQVRLKGQPKIRILVSTDVMSEGLNLQDADVIVNYDLHWNPVRLIQRFGRIDRIGSENEVIWGYNFLPETKLDRNLGLTQVLRTRINEIQETIGEDSAILDKTEHINKKSMFAIYEKKKSGQLELFQDDDDEFIDINEAEEILRSMQKDDPAEFERIANLRDGIRSSYAKMSDQGTYVFCQAGRYQQMILFDKDRAVVSRDIPTVLGRIKCPREEPSVVLPKDHNKRVMEAKKIFEEEIRHRKASQKYGLHLTVQQRYVLRELKVLYSQTDDTDQRGQINILEKAFKNPLTMAVKRQINTLRRNGVTGENLLRILADIYHEHGMKDYDANYKDPTEAEVENIPRIICSEALV
jgi:superfamily II DNA/RNA helicase/HKD family nuclease